MGIDGIATCIDGPIETCGMMRYEKELSILRRKLEIAETVLLRIGKLNVGIKNRYVGDYSDIALSALAEMAEVK